MSQQINQRMRALRSGRKDFAARSLNASLSRILQEGLSALHGCIVLNKFKRNAQNVTVADCHDETGYECFLNHLHIGDYVQGSPSEELGQGMLFLSQLANMLEERYPRLAFQLILSCSDSGCTVRFHMVRPNQKWIADDLEGYEDAALFLLTVSAAGGAGGAA